MGLARTLRVIHGPLLFTFTPGPCGLGGVVSKCFSKISSGMVTFVASFSHIKKVEILFNIQHAVWLWKVLMV